MRPHVLIGAVALLVATAVPVRAHSEVPGLRTVLDAVDPAVDGLDVSISAGSATQLVLTNRTGSPVEVLDEQGTPFLRISDEGVEANVTAPAWFRTATPEGDGRVPAAAKPGAAPSWRAISEDPTWAWYDHRLHPDPVGAAAPTEAGGVVRLDEWRVPLLVGGRAVEVRGHRELLRPDGSLRSSLSPREPAPGVRVGVVDGPVPAVSLVVQGRQRVVVLGEQGEPMARIGDGGVEVNLASPTWLVTAAAAGEVPAGEVGADVPARWERAGSGRALTWLEPRALYRPGLPPADVLERDEPTDLGEWTLPLEVDGERLELVGSTRWLPLDLADPEAGPGAGRLPPGAYVAAGLTGLLLLVLLGRALQRATPARRQE